MTADQFSFKCPRCTRAELEPDTKRGRSILLSIRLKWHEWRGNKQKQKHIINSIDDTINYTCPNCPYEDTLENTLKTVAKGSQLRGR